MKIEKIKLDEIVEYKNNAKKHQKKRIKQIADSIQEFGFNNPILIDDKNVIIAGHARYGAAKLLNLEEVPVIKLTHLTDSKKKAYILADNKIIGLSKLNRTVDYFARRPQVQERLTNDILKFLKKMLDTSDIAIVIDAVHLCVKIRGVQHERSITRTSALEGAFKDNQATRNEFFSTIPAIGDFNL